jgi:hypothetical protein
LPLRNPFLQVAFPKPLANDSLNMHPLLIDRLLADVLRPATADPAQCVPPGSALDLVERPAAAKMALLKGAHSTKPSTLKDANSPPAAPTSKPSRKSQRGFGKQKNATTNAETKKPELDS